MQTPQCPVLAGPWQELFVPHKYGTYVNDHSIVQDLNGKWHLFGITSFLGGAPNERYFVHAKGDSLLSPMKEIGKVIDNGTRAWAPGVIRNENLYYMYFGPAPTKMAVSIDLNEWMWYELELVGHPPLAIHRDHFVMRLNDYTWMMYAVGLYQGRGCVSCCVSNDLLHWRFVQYALTSAPSAPLTPAWGAFESPYVVCRDGLYYLFVTYTDCRKENYQDTLLFCSANPYDFGCYSGQADGAQPIARLKAHAGEVLCDPTGQWYLTTCGWRGYDIPVEGGVAIAPLNWK